MTTVARDATITFFPVGTMEEVIEKAKKLMGGLDTDVVRAKPAVRARIASAMEGVKKEIDALVAERPKRAFDIDE